MTDPKWANDDDVKEWMAWMKENMPGAELSDSLNEAGYMYAKTLEQVLKQCGDDLTRENIMKQAANLKDFHLAAAAARQRDQHQPDRLSRDPVHEAAALQRQELGLRRGLI